MRNVAVTGSYSAAKAIHFYFHITYAPAFSRGLPERSGGKYVGWKAWLDLIAHPPDAEASVTTEPPEEFRHKPLPA
ncbi:MAG: hypothetical protein H6974_04985 [Gammaproteobacteria bacterium]|nr:hypothetical protein [Gammaproteobacteria bacterium]MCP5196136.1 hypothetical protein [Gammaproteobacteria bacterium]